MPVTIVRQCLTLAATHSLDEVVIVSCHCQHAQTTLLHVVFTVLSPPSLILWDTCNRAQNSACFPWLQFKVLELCLRASLDQVLLGQLSDDLVISNLVIVVQNRNGGCHTLKIGHVIGTVDEPHLTTVSLNLNHYILVHKHLITNTKSRSVSFELNKIYFYIVSSIFESILKYQIQVRLLQIDISNTYFHPCTK